MLFRIKILSFVFLIFALSPFASIAQNNTFIFAVTGKVRQPDGTPAASGLTVAVTNTTRNLTRTTTLGKRVEGEYIVNFLSTTGAPVAKTNDSLKIRITDADGGLIVEGNHKIVSTEIQALSAVINLQIKLQDVFLSRSLSTVELFPLKSVVADGKATATIYVTLKDIRNIPVVGQRFLVTATGSNNTISPTSPTNIIGEAVAEISSMKAEEKIVTVTIGDIALVPITVQFVAGDPHPDKSTVRVDEAQVPADNKSAANIEVQVIDPYGNPAVDRIIEIISTGTDNTITIAKPTDINGRAKGTITSKKAEIKTLTIREARSGVSLIEKPQITFISGRLSQNQSLITASSPVVADGKAKSLVTITLMDQFANPISDEEAKINVSGSNNEIIQSATLTNSYGKTVAQITSTKSETKYITANVRGVPLVATAKVEFLPTFLDTTTLTVDPNTLPADGVSTSVVVVSVVDTFGNRIDFQKPTLKVTDGAVSEAQFQPDKGVWLAMYTAGRLPGPNVISVLIDDVVQTSMTIILTKPDQTSQRIKSTSILPASGVTNDVVVFQLVGTGGGTATVSINGIVGVSNLSMAESTTSSGIYTIPYTIKEGDQVSNVPVIFRLNTAIDQSNTIFINASDVSVKIEFLGEKTARLGALKKIRGKLIPEIPDQLLQFTINKPDGSDNFIKDVKTDKSGQFSFNLAFDLAGGWFINANYGGNANYLPVSGSAVYVAMMNVGKAIIVLGGNSQTNPIWDAFRVNAEFVHHTFTTRGLDPDSDIKFFSSEPNQTANADDFATLVNLEEAIGIWAKPQLGSQSPLFLYLISANLDPDFLINDKNILTPDLLDSWLDVVPVETPIFIMVEASYSGNFITQSRNGRPVLASANRTIVTSSHSSRQNRIMVNGYSFSRLFFDQIQANKTVGEAFIAARNTMQSTPIYRLQYPQIDSNSNGLANETRDLTVVSSLYIPMPIEVKSTSLPLVEMMSKNRTLPPKTRLLTVEVEAPNPDITEVRATIIPPSFNSEKIINQWSDLKFDQISLVTGGSEVYSGIYDNLSTPGDYTIYAHAVRNDGVVFYADSPIKVRLKATIDPSKPTVLLDRCYTTSQLCDQPVEVGSVFELVMRVENIAGLQGFGTIVRYDPSQVDAVSISEGEFLKRGDADTRPAQLAIDEKNSNIKITIYRLGGNGMSGNGVLANIKFRAKDADVAAITFEKVDFSDVEASPISVNLVDASIPIKGFFPLWDINRDGTTNIFDLVLAGNQMGQKGKGLSGDVNQDNQIDIFDIVLIGNHLGEGSMFSSPELIRSLPIAGSLSILRKIQSELQLKLAWSDSDHGFLATQSVVDYLIASLENQNPNTMLYQNYPNPFNPETWIPFEIAEDCLVLIQIHDTNGNLIRELNLGFCSKGIYTSKSGAAYWDGCNQQGESVSSGMYFYLLNNAGQPRKMIILK